MAVDMSQYERAGSTFKFDHPGDTLKGEIVQIKDPHERENKFNENIELVMAVTVRQADGEEWSIWPRLQPYSSMGGAIAEATADHGSQLEVGGTLAVQYVEDMDTGKGNPAKIYAAEYKPPTKQVDVSAGASDKRASLLGDDDSPF